MPDVFVSYARPTEPHAKRIADALRAEGYTVWRDEEIPAHVPYGEVIEERLKSSKAVVVIWSADAAHSQWVRAEADAARHAGTLVQVSVDGTLPPMPFNQIQCADLQAWRGESDAPAWCRVQASVAALTSGGSTPSVAAAPQPVRPRRASICVLPFINMSGDPEQEYFSDGISEDITTDLSKISALAVTARNTAFTFKGTPIDVPTVARKLNVSHVLEGSVRKSGSRVRISAQLIDGETGDHIWAERYDRNLDDIFAIQDEISKSIVAALSLKLLPQEKKAIEQRGTTSSEAYNLYLMARQYWIDFADMRRQERVIRICKRATEVDPEYAQAWALMALAQAHLFYGFSANDDLDNGAEAAERALALDASIAEAHLPRAWRLAEQGRLEEANAEIATALRLNGASWEVNKEAARLYYRQRRIADATRHLERATELMEADIHGWGMLFASYHAQGNTQAIQHCAEMISQHVQDVLTRDPENGVALALGALSFGALGQLDRSRQWIERALLIDPDNLFMRYNVAWGLIAIFNDREAAVDVLGPVLEGAGPSTIRLAANDPNLDSLRDDPRFQQMLARANERLELGRSALSKPAAF